LNITTISLQSSRDTLIESRGLQENKTFAQRDLGCGYPMGQSIQDRNDEDAAGEMVTGLDG